MPQNENATFHDLTELADKFGESVKVLNAADKKLAAEKNDLAARLTGVEQELTRRPGNGGGGSGVKSLGQLVTEHPEFNEVAKLAQVKGRHTLVLRNAITTLPTSAGPLVPTDHRPGLVVPMLRRRLTVRDLVQPGQTTSGAVEYPVQNVRTLNAAVVSEGATKPESAIGFELKTVNVRTIAHWVKASRQSLADAPSLRGIIDSELRYGLQLAEETQLLFGDGTGQNLFGIVPQATSYDTTGEGNVANLQRVDILTLALEQVRLALLEPSGVVMNDSDAMKLLLLKDSNGNYLNGSGPFGPMIRELAGVPLVPTPAMPAGSFVVGAFRDGAQIYDREEINVEVATEHAEDFTSNMVTVLAEERLAFAVRRPAAFVYGTYSASF